MCWITVLPLIIKNMNFFLILNNFFYIYKFKHNFHILNLNLFRIVL